MSNVIDITSKLNEVGIDRNRENHDYVLDACEEVFEYGVVVAALTKDGIVEVSTTMEDKSEVVEMLLAAALSLQGKIDNDKLD
jgi:hypothetical protein